MLEKRVEVLQRRIEELEADLKTKDDKHGEQIKALISFLLFHFISSHLI